MASRWLCAGNYGGQSLTCASLKRGMTEIDCTVAAGRPVRCARPAPHGSFLDGWPITSQGQMLPQRHIELFVCQALGSIGKDGMPLYLVHLEISVAPTYAASELQREL